MTILKLIALSAALLFGLHAGPVPIARTHRVTMNGTNGKYQMTPGSIEVSPGDTLVFRVESGGPHSLGVDPQGLTRAVHETWNQAFPRRVGDLRGPLLRQNDSYEVVIPRAVPKGEYRIFCLPHRAYDEDLKIEVK